MPDEKPKISIDDFAKLREQFDKQWVAPEPDIETLQLTINKLRNQIRYLEYQISLLRSRKPAYDPYAPVWPMHPANPYYQPTVTC